MADFVGPIPPIGFPAPVLNSARTLSASVQLLDGSVETHIVIASSSGAHYLLGARLREAIYGEVRRGYAVEALPAGGFRRRPASDTGVDVAIKVVYRDRLLMYQGSSEDPMGEIACLAYIRDTPPSSAPNRYPNLCYFYEACETAQYIFSVMEFVPGMELYDYLDMRERLPPAEARAVFRQILAGWAVLHGLGISHRDMSLENVMYCPPAEDGTGMRAVVIDFGQAKRALVGADGSVARWPPLGQAGKPAYVAPEVLLNTAPFLGSQADVWSMGVMLFMLIAGHPPCGTALALDDLYCRICAGQLPQLIARWGHPFSAEAVGLVDGMLRQHGWDRLPLQGLLSHPWWDAGPAPP
jgi:serine/threonine protein kinase